ncbi:MAG: hypothetical protein IJT77_03255 [Clostridia bacterium]|nr:hypothetical protein [Clostridia bacterium]
MRIVNLDAEFEKYLKAWMQKHSAQYGNNLDKLEEMVPDVYMTFLETPLALLDGKSPEEWYEAFSDPAELIETLKAHIRERVSVPDLLMERIVAVPGTEPYLLEMIRDDSLDEEIRMTAVSLMQEIGGNAPMEHYLDIITPLEEPSDLGDICAESLVAMGGEVMEPVLARYPRAGAAAKNIFADILCNFEHDDRIYSILEERFRTQTDERALFASYLAKYGDERALPVLVEASREPGLGYLDFVEIANAIEALGGDRPAEREYAGDPYYEALGRL